ncbi:hypothetical protein F4779DRAFT_641435 [Xylariaceae sp. FL0662B]|nr:hypothetical protein F4779DRAFT_641435 [Xylariaceae sp. FL0662B]
MSSTGTMADTREAPGPLEYPSRSFWSHWVFKGQRSADSAWEHWGTEQGAPEGAGDVVNPTSPLAEGGSDSESSSGSDVASVAIPKDLKYILDEYIRLDESDDEKSYSSGYESSDEETICGAYGTGAASPKSRVLPIAKPEEQTPFADVPDITVRFGTSDRGDAISDMIRGDPRLPAVVRWNEDLARNAFVTDIPTNPEEFSNEFFEVKESPLGGRGAFARRDLKQGEIVIVEAPLFRSTKDTIYDDLEKLSPEHREAFHRMHAYPRTPNADHTWSIFLTNSFAVRPVSCLYLVTARFNHACKPANNVSYYISRRGNLIILHMNQDVEAGTELCISYGEVSPAELYRSWGFRCACGSCPSLSDADMAELLRTQLKW